MEEKVLEFFQSFHSMWADRFFVAATMLGEEYFYLAVIAVMYWCFSKRFAMGLSFALLTSSLANGAVKEIVAAPRPFETLDIRTLRRETATGYSFPSGHTQSAATFFSYLAMFASRYWLAAAFVLTALVGLSRLYLGVHWPRDVVFGAFLGLGMAAAVGHAYRLISSRLIAVLTGILAAAAALFFESPDLLKASGALIGLSAGHLFESFFVDFRPAGTIMGAVGRVLFGAGVTALFYFGLRLVAHDLYLLRYAVTVFVMTGLVPVAFARDAAPRSVGFGRKGID